MAQLELIHIYFLLAVPLLDVILALPVTFWVWKSIVLVFFKMRSSVEELTAGLHLKFFTKGNMMLLMEISSSLLLAQFRAIFTHFLKQSESLNGWRRKALEVISFNPMAQARPPIASCVQVAFEYLQRMKPPPAPWRTCISTWLPLQEKSVSWCTEPPVCQSVPIACHWAPLRTSWVPSLHPPFRYLYSQMRFHRDFSFPGWTVAALSAFFHLSGAPGP